MRLSSSSSSIKNESCLFCHEAVSLRSWVHDCRLAMTECHWNTAVAQSILQWIISVADFAKSLQISLVGCRIELFRDFMMHPCVSISLPMLHQPTPSKKQTKQTTATDADRKHEPRFKTSTRWDSITYLSGQDAIQDWNYGGSRAFSVFLSTAVIWLSRRWLDVRESRSIVYEGCWILRKEEKKLRSELSRWRRRRQGKQAVEVPAILLVFTHHPRRQKLKLNLSANQSVSRETRPTKQLLSLSLWFSKN